MYTLNASTTMSSDSSFAATAATTATEWMTRCFALDSCFAIEPSVHWAARVRVPLTQATRSPAGCSSPTKKNKFALLRRSLSCSSDAASKPQLQASSWVTARRSVNRPVRHFTSLTLMAGGCGSSRADSSSCSSFSMIVAGMSGSSGGGGGGGESAPPITWLPSSGVYGLQADCTETPDRRRLGGLAGSALDRLTGVGAYEGRTSISKVMPAVLFGVLGWSNTRISVSSNSFVDVGS
mmetsp:Transcript_127646/g.220743  ORF Transcript_127646/g.220743 Transcript_127646/m.220743 type:complete len:237 (+) Transcript_127646:1254-1964(+)